MQLRLTMIETHHNYQLLQGWLCDMEICTHEMTLSHEGHRPECDNVNRVCTNPMSHNPPPATIDLLPRRELAFYKIICIYF